MKSTLNFKKKKYLSSNLGPQSSVPDLLGSLMVQNDLTFQLDETDEIFEGYGTLKTSYPYKHFNCYDRNLKETEFQTAVLENDYLCATFLPELGGRLWSLIDKTTGKNLLYTNDVIRFSNLAVRNAWFSGGVEWNIGVIGHSPLTTMPLYTASLENEDGTPVLRMYEYERIRNLEYQMDFWLGKTDHYLNCCMRVVNSTGKVVPMYWWSNMAVPEYEQGRIVVPAEEAFTSSENTVRKVPIPLVNQVDISKYQDIPRQIDYFFHIPEESPKYIANLNDSGYGLLHISTKRLKSRKLFSWGNNDGSARWQEFLTKDAGRYVEIQAGLGKTQYGCIPMAPHTAWEWMEQYGPCQTTAHKEDYSVLRDEVTNYVNQQIAARRLDDTMQAHHKIALQPGTLVHSGSPYGAMENMRRRKHEEKLLSDHLQYNISREKAEQWTQFLTDGRLPDLDIQNVPEDFFCDEDSFTMLKTAAADPTCKNWYIHYQLGVFYMQKNHYKAAKPALLHSLSLADNPWAYHALACLYLLQDQKAEAAACMEKGLSYRKTDLAYLIESFRIFLDCESYAPLVSAYQQSAPDLQANTRLTYGYITACMHTGKTQEAYNLLSDHFTLDDLRECDGSMNRLWTQITQELFGEATEVPHELNFASL